MSSTTCNIRIASGKDIRVSNRLLQTLGIGSIRRLRLTFGSMSVNVSLKPLRRDDNLLQIPVSVASQLKLPHAGKCLLTTRGLDEVRIGPLVGILAARSTSDSSSFGSMASFFRRLISIGKDRSYFFVFSPRDVDWERETVAGYFPNPSGVWQRKEVPLPDVVYNRMQSRITEGLTAMYSFKEKFLRRSIPIFNWAYFDKSEVYKLLEGDDVFKHVPETVIGPSGTEVRELLSRHGTVYMKPSGGSLGLGIYRIQRVSNRGYTVRYRSMGKNHAVGYKNFDAAMNLLHRHRKGKLDRYIAQQGISLIEVDGCPVDFRFHMTKNGQNQWGVTAIGAKKAGKGSITTHVASGGKLINTEQVLQHAFGSNASSVLQRAKTTAVSIAQALERRYPYLLGEIGFDIGVDKSGNVWMFEANAKPGRSIFKHPAAKSQERDSLTNLFDYCVYLSKFRQGGNDHDHRSGQSGKAPRRRDLNGKGQQAKVARKL